MKKILFISNICKKITNFHIVSLEAAEKLGYEFHFAANFDEMPDEEKKLYSNIHFHQVNLKRFPFHPQNLKAYLELNSIIETIKPNAIHCNTPIGGALGRICGANKNIQMVIYTAHGFHFYNGAKGVGSKIYKILELLMAKKTDVLITMNNEDYLISKKMKLKKNGKTFFVHGVGVSTSEYQNIQVNCDKKRNELGLSNSDIVCIAMGDLIKRKNYDTAIRAIANLNDENVHFLICGKGPEEEYLKDLCKTLKVDKQIHFLGFRNDVKELLKISDCFLFCSFQEGLPRSLMEAMASGLPCIVSKIRGNVDLIEDGKNGFLCTPDNPDEYCSALLTITNDHYLRDRMRNNNLIAVQKYDVENVKKEMFDIYSKVLM